MSNNRTIRHFWNEKETDFLLQTLKEMNIDRYKDGRKNRNSLIFRKVCAKHKAAGYRRSCDQVKHRWKTLKSIYYKAKRQNVTSSDAFKHFDTMEEIFGHRPLVVSKETRADIDSKDASPLSESKSFTFEGDECDEENDVDDEESGNQDIQTLKIENDPFILTQPSLENTDPVESSASNQPSISLEITNCTQPSTSQQTPVQDVFKCKSPCCTSLHAQYQSFIERMQQTQNLWLERQQEQSHAREERLIARVLAEHTRSMEALVNQLFAGLRSLLPHSNLQASPTPIRTPPDIFNTYPHHVNNSAENWQPAHNPTSSISSQPEDNSLHKISESVNQ